MKNISVKQALNSGIYTKHSDMENGELRYRLIGGDNSAYIRTEAYKACWENSHYHECCYESYIVQKGTIYFCELKDNGFSVKKLEEGDSVVTKPFIAHNVYMCEGAITHTVKFGRCKEDDWNASEQLDILANKLTVDELEIKCKE